MQGRLSDAAAAAVRGLLPSYAGGNLSSLCSWADGVKLRYPWSAPLHYIDTPDHLCSYTYDSLLILSSNSTEICMDMLSHCSSMHHVGFLCCIVRRLQGRG